MYVRIYVQTKIHIHVCVCTYPYETFCFCQPLDRLGKYLEDILDVVQVHI